MLCKSLIALAALVLPALGCEACNGAQYGEVTMTRNVRRMQPGALSAHTKPTRKLEWGELNFLHTTDTHGWLEGHLKEQNYGADWGDFVSFTKHMRQKASDYGVDLLLVDTGDLHDGNGLSDITATNGNISNQIFEKIDYDILTIGNHELYVTDIAYETFNQFAKAYGERYLTTNVEIMNPNTGKFEYIGHRSREFTTPKGVKILAMGILYDFTGNSNVSRITLAADLVKEAWFTQTIKSTTADLIVLLGHNPPRPGMGGSFPQIYSAIRKLRPYKPIQIFGGHSHIRDFVVFDHTATALESGRYCETLGWLSINGLRDGAIKNEIPKNVPQATRPAVSATAKVAAAAPPQYTKGVSHPRYSRRYIDWNRLSFEFHAEESQSETFNTQAGVAVTKEILADRKKLGLQKLYGCAPRTWCFSCTPFGSSGNIFTVLTKAVAAEVVNKARANTPRFLILNTGGIRFDLVQGPFTVDDKYIVSPFTDTFLYIPNVPFAQAQKVLANLNAQPSLKRSTEPQLESRDFGFSSPAVDMCLDPATVMVKRDNIGTVIRRQNTSTLTPGYTTTDDFGTDGDDTKHTTIPNYPLPTYFQANASFPVKGSPKTVDLVFIDYIASNVIAALKQAGGNFNQGQVKQYLPTTFTTQDYLPLYAQHAPDWQKNVPNCPVGNGTLG